MIYGDVSIRRPRNLGPTRRAALTIGGRKSGKLQRDQGERRERSGPPHHVERTRRPTLTPRRHAEQRSKLLHPNHQRPHAWPLDEDEKIP